MADLHEHDLTAELRKTINSVTGSRAAKSRLAQQGRLAWLASLLVAPLHAAALEMRILAANCVGSVAQNATPATLLAILRADVPYLLLTLITRLAEASDSSAGATAYLRMRALEAALRALRAVMCSVSDQIGHSPRWSIGSGWGFASMSGLEHTGTRNSALPENRPVQHSLRQDTSWNSAGPPCVSIRKEILLRWFPAAAGEVCGGDAGAQEPMLKAARLRESTQLLSVPHAMQAGMEEAAILDQLEPFAALNWLCRSAISLVFAPRHLRLLLGSVLFARAMVHECDTSRFPTPTSPNALGSGIGVHSHAVASRAQALTTAGMVGEVLGSCITVAGVEHYQSSPETTRLRMARQSAPVLATPREEIARRCAALLAFSARESPFPVDALPAGTGAVQCFLSAAELHSAQAQEAILWLFYELLAASNEATKAQLAVSTSVSGTFISAILLNLANSRTPAVRLDALCCVSQLDGMAPTQLLAGIMELVQHAGAVQVQACFALARLVRERPVLQEMAADEFSAVDILAGIVQNTNPVVTSAGAKGSASLSKDELVVRLHEGCLTALAALAVRSDAMRHRVADCCPLFLAGIVRPSLVASALGVQLAACRLVRVLSRTVGILRTSLLDAGVAEKMLCLLKEKDNAMIHTEVIGTICNMLVKFSPMKEYLVMHEGLECLARFSRSPRGHVRFNALWAIKNAVWESDPPFREKLMALVGWDHLAKLLRSQDTCIREQALNIVRNLTSSNALGDGCANVDLTLGHLGETYLLDSVEEAVWSLQGGDRATEQAAYIFVNIAAGGWKHRELLISRPNTMDALCFFLRHKSASVREAGVRCGYNLCYRAARDAEDAAESVWERAAARLRAFGYDVLLRDLVDDIDANVKEIARDTRAQLESNVE
ncbi:hypothetical protein MVES1_001180 [Malassezia vespertilionis]|nr:uncharacterized protein MVES1_001180 [Malassezia vespertilionis]WFD05846.1 hypothetical protein MVES1_001180 [Malassezia vespertilionis]